MIDNNQGQSAEKRSNDILNCSEAAGRTKLAKHLAEQTDVSAESARKILAAAAREESDGSDIVALARSIGVKGFEQRPSNDAAD